MKALGTVVELLTIGLLPEMLPLDIRLVIVLVIDVESDEVEM